MIVFELSHCLCDNDDVLFVRCLHSTALSPWPASSQFPSAEAFARGSALNFHGICSGAAPELLYDSNYKVHDQGGFLLLSCMYIGTFVNDFENAISSRKEKIAEKII